MFLDPGVLPLFGVAKGLNPPRVAAAPDPFWLPAFRAGGVLPSLPLKLLPEGVPALGFCTAALFAEFALPRRAVPRASTEPFALARPPACTGVTRFRCRVCCTCEACCWNDAGRDAAPDRPKKRCCPPLRIVDAAAERPLADKLACVGTTGTFPVIMRAVR